ncbi:MAG: 4Fe-4S binding protein [Candidatus Bathyarchaeota archaeon]|nr:4Fe-4S binding protein [Candidatus Bathyarchaeota archaeon]
MNQKTALCFTIAIALLLCILSVYNVQQATGCYGPHITGEINKTEFTLNENATVTGEICPAEANITVRITFTRPDYTWIDHIVQTDSQGRFNVTQKLDMVGYWNIFPIYGHICDRLHATVVDPAEPSASSPMVKLPPYKPNFSLITVAAIALSVGVVAATTGTKNKTRKISSFRLLVQIAFVFILFAGVFIDHFNLPVPAEQIAPHELLVGATEFGEAMPDGLPLPVFACYYPCGRTFLCPLWPIQTYIYPFADAGRGWGVNYAISGLERLAIVFGGVILLSILLGKFFCGWICPFGLYMDLITRLRKAFKIKHKLFSDGFNAKFHQLGYVILALLIILSVIFGSQAIVGAQLVPGTEQGGFVYNYFSAPFCQVCPMKPLCILLQTSVGLMRPEWIVENTAGTFFELGYYITSLNLFILGLVTVAAFFYRRVWCRICPLGALIALFNRFPPFKWISVLRLEKNEEKCTKCGVCKRVCPTQVTEVYEQKGGDVTTSHCLLCLRCVEMCPYEDALSLKAAGKTVVKSRNWL